MSNSELKKHTSAVITTMLPKLEPIISSLLVQQPHWQMAFHLSIGFFGYAMALKQEDVNEFVEYIKDNPRKYRKEIVASEEFQDGFVQIFRTYLELRINKKKEVLKKILEGFSYSTRKKSFPLERLDDVLLKITPETLEILIFIKQDIVPIREQKITEEANKKYSGDTHHNKQWWINLERTRHVISGTISTWIHQNYDPNSAQVKKQYGVKDKWDKKLINEVYEIQDKKKESMYSAVDELINLGVMKIQISSGGGGMSMAGGSSFSFSQLGYQFMKYAGSQTNQEMDC